MKILIELTCSSNYFKEINQGVDYIRSFSPLSQVEILASSTDNIFKKLHLYF